MPVALVRLVNVGASSAVPLPIARVNRQYLPVGAGVYPPWQTTAFGQIRYAPWLAADSSGPLWWSRSCPRSKLRQIIVARL